MLWVFGGLARVVVVLIGFVAVGRETGIQPARARPAVFDLEEAVDFIADELPDEVAGQVTHDDVRWVLRADVGLLEDATVEGGDEPGARVVETGRRRWPASSRRPRRRIASMSTTRSWPSSMPDCAIWRRSERSAHRSRSPTTRRPDRSAGRAAALAAWR